MDFSTILQKSIYVRDKHYDDRGVVVFDDTMLDIKPKNVDYEKLLSHFIENITKALHISDKNKVSGTFVLYVQLNPQRKHCINKRSMLNIISILNSLYKKNLYKCIFRDSNKYFRLIYGTLKPILDSNLKKKFLFLKNNTPELKQQTIN